jgi:hypothetical protein
MPFVEPGHVRIAHKLAALCLGITFLNRFPFVIGNAEGLHILRFDEKQDFGGVCLPLLGPCPDAFEDGCNLILRHEKILPHRPSFTTATTAHFRGIFMQQRLIRAA